MATFTTSSASTNPGTVSTWQIDTAKSEASFTVRNRLFFLIRVPVQGRFTGITGTIKLDSAAPERSSVTAEIPTASIDTKNGRRDKHLRSADFFEVERFPTMTFSSTSIKPVDPKAGRYRITGELALRGNTRMIELDAQAGPERNPSSGRLRFTATTTLNRHDFGLSWANPLQKVYDEVTVTLQIEAVPK